MIEDDYCGTLTLSNRNDRTIFEPERESPCSNWRPRRDLNPCCRRERPVSWARLDDGDPCEPCRIRTGDPLLKRQMLYRLS